MKILLLLAIVFYPLSALSKTIIVAADEWYPMNGDPKADNRGFMIEIAELALKDKGLTLKYRIMPWERAIKSARENSIHCIVGAGDSEAPGLVLVKNHTVYFKPHFIKTKMMISNMLICPLYRIRELEPYWDMTMMKK